MPPKPSNKGAPSGLGRALVRDRQKSLRSRGDASSHHTTELSDGASWTKYQSVTEQRDLDEFLTTAALAQRDFTAERRNVTVVTLDSRITTVLTPEREAALQEQIELNKDKMRVPRRPRWTRDMTAEELDARERDAFLEWRRGLAQLQEGDSGLTITPFERNIEVWRQLWRVVDRSDVLVQIVDARNPLLFRCTDLEEYVHEIDRSKRNLLLVNKADLLTEEQRARWADFFEANGIAYVFWSAALAREALEAAAEKEAASDSDQDSDGDDESDEDDEDDEAEADEVSAQLGSDAGVPTLSVNQPRKDTRTAIATRDEIFALFRRLNLESDSPKERFTVGFVGYPNVGKSSTINALSGTKMVAVAATPGKTKHFQSINVAEDLILLDCPGLVFPNYTVQKEDLVCNGVLPVDQLRDGVGPTALVCLRIPRALLQATYGIHLMAPAEDEDPNRPPTASELLTAYATIRGFMKAGHSNADEQRAARVILKDYINGKLLFCHPPPGISAADFNRPVHTAMLEDLRARKKTAAKLAATEMMDVPGEGRADWSTGAEHTRTVGGSRYNPQYVNTVDSEFFAQSRVGVRIKGKNPTQDLLRAKSGEVPVVVDTSKKHHRTRKVKTRNLAI